MRTVAGAGASALPTAGVLAVVVLVASPAYADGGFVAKPDCGGSGCEIRARADEQGQGSRPAGSGSQHAPSLPQAGQPVEPQAHCTEPEGGMASCTTTMAAPRLGGGSGGGIDAEALAEKARARLELPEPDIGSAPPLNTTVVVQFPVWLWIDADQWQPRTAEVAVGGGSASVTATPREAVWDMGDGTTVICEGPGTVLDLAVHTAGTESPDCGYTYAMSSKNRTGATDTVEARMVWDVSWESSTGEGGTLPEMETAAARQVEVVEVHSLVTDG